MKPTYLLKVLNHHARHCAVHPARFICHRRASGVHVFSGDRRCTCGRDRAIDELTTLLENQLPQPTDELTVEQLRQRLGRPTHARA